MTDVTNREKICEMMISDIGEMTVVLRPSLPFAPEGCRINGGQFEIFGDGAKVNLEIPEEIRSEANEIDQCLLLEFGRSGSETERETDLLKHR